MYAKVVKPHAQQEFLATFVGSKLSAPLCDLNIFLSREREENFKFLRNNRRWNSDLYYLLSLYLFLAL